MIVLFENNTDYNPFETEDNDTTSHFYGILLADANFYIQDISL